MAPAPKIRPRHETPPENPNFGDVPIYLGGVYIRYFVMLKLQLTQMFELLKVSIY